MLKTVLIRPLLLALPLLMAGACLAQDPRTLPLRELQRQFLACERQAAQTLLGFSEAAVCSHIYEELLHRGFEGDFKRLLAWWQAERAAARIAQSPMP